MPYWEHFLLEGVKFAAFVFVCGCLMRFRFGRKTTGLAAAGALLVILALQAGLLLAGLDATLVLTLLPVTAYLPAILAVHLLSGSGFLPTVSVWSAGVLLVGYADSSEEEADGVSGATERDPLDEQVTYVTAE